MFLFCVITFGPIITKICEAHQNDCQNLSFVKGKNKYGGKMARKGHTKAIYKVTFISEHTLCLNIDYFMSGFQFLSKSLLWKASYKRVISAIYRG